MEGNLQIKGYINFNVKSLRPGSKNKSLKTKQNTKSNWGKANTDKLLRNYVF